MTGLSPPGQTHPSGPPEAPNGAPNRDPIRMAAAHAGPDHRIRHEGRGIPAVSPMKGAAQRAGATGP